MYGIPAAHLPETVDAQVRPEAAAVLDAKGLLPLHRAAMGKAPLELVNALLAAHPGAVRAFGGPDRNRLPLHHAVDACAPAEIVEALLRAGADPDVVYRPDRDRAHTADWRWRE